MGFILGVNRWLRHVVIWRHSSFCSRCRDGGCSDTEFRRFTRAELHRSHSFRDESAKWMGHTASRSSGFPRLRNKETWGTRAFHVSRIETWATQFSRETGVQFMAVLRFPEIDQRFENESAIRD